MECYSKLFCELFQTGACTGSLLNEIPPNQLPRCFIPSRGKTTLPTAGQATQAFYKGFEDELKEQFKKLGIDAKVMIGTAEELRKGSVEIAHPIEGAIRKFTTGANRDTDNNKLDYEGFFSPIVMECFAEYMNKCRKLKDGTTRESDNWQKGIPLDVYMKSMYRHFMDVWMEHRGYASREGIIEGLCGLLFNVQGYLFEILKAEYEEEEKDE